MRNLKGTATWINELMLDEKGAALFRSARDNELSCPGPARRYYDGFWSQVFLQKNTAMRKGFCSQLYLHCTDTK